MKRSSFLPLLLASTLGAPAQTTFTNPGTTEANNIFVEANWSSGLPTDANPGTIAGDATWWPADTAGDGSGSTSAGPNNASGVNITITSGTLSRVGSFIPEFTDSTITLQGGNLNNDGPGSRVFRLSGTSVLTVGSGSTFTHDEARGIELQNDGAGTPSLVVDGGTLLGGLGSGNSTGISTTDTAYAFLTFTANGGMASFDALAFNVPLPYIDFVSGSTGVLELGNGDLTLYQGLWDTGNLRIDGANTGSFLDNFDGNGGKIALAGVLPDPFLATEAAPQFQTTVPVALNDAITLTNTGLTEDLEVTDVSLVPGGDSSAVTNFVVPSTPFTIPKGGGSQDITFTFTANDGPRLYSFDISVSSDDEAESSPRIISVGIDVTADPLLDAPASYVSSTTGDASVETVTLTNAGLASSLTVSSVTATETGTATPESTVSNLVPLTPFAILPTESVDVSFDFTPTAPGLYEFDLNVFSDDQGAASPTVIPVSIDVQSPLIGVAGSFVDLGLLSSSDTTLVTVTNTSAGVAAVDLNLNAGTTTITGSAGFSITDLPADPIAPGASAEVEVTFDPTGLSGVQTATLTLGSDDYLNATPQVELVAFAEPDTPNAARLDFGPTGSPVQPGYTFFESVEGGSQTIGGITFTISSPQGDIAGGLTSGPDDLRRDSAQTGGGGSPATNGDYVSILMTGFADGTLNLASSHNRAGPFNPEETVSFGEPGALVDIATGVNAVDWVGYSTTVEAGKTYELRVTETSTNSTAYIAGLILWGDSVPGGTAFTSWAEGYGLDPDWLPGDDPALDGTPGGDPDGDGDDNATEFAVDGDPTDPSSSSKVVARVVDLGGADVLTLTFPVRAGAALDFDGPLLKGIVLGPVDGVTYRIQGASDLGFEGPNASLIDEVTPSLDATLGLPPLNPGWTYRSFRTDGDTDTDARDFLRLLIEGTP